MSDQTPTVVLFEGPREATRHASAASSPRDGCSMPVDQHPIERAAGAATARFRRTSALRRVDPERWRGPLYRGYAWLPATRPFAWVARRIGWKLDPVLCG